MTRPAHGIPLPRSVRARDRQRVCRDCGNPYRYTTAHTNPRYCTQCLPGHTRICQICQAPFPIEHDTDRLCPAHVVHPALF